MRPRAGPSDLRYCKLQPEKDLRGLMKPKLKPMDTVDGQWTMDEAPSASALSAISTYESSEEEHEEMPAYDTTPRRQRPLSRVDLRRKLEGEPVFPDRTPPPAHPAPTQKTLCILHIENILVPTRTPRARRMERDIVRRIKTKEGMNIL